MKMYSFDMTDELKIKLLRLKKKYPKRVEIIKKKIKDILKNPTRYKNLKYDLKKYKRAHINRHFVLVFRVDEDFVLFVDFEHHDRVYK